MWKVILSFCLFIKNRAPPGGNGPAYKRILGHTFFAFVRLISEPHFYKKLLKYHIILFFSFFRLISEIFFRLISESACITKFWRRIQWLMWKIRQKFISMCFKRWICIWNSLNLKKRPLGTWCKSLSCVDFWMMQHFFFRFYFQIFLNFWIFWIFELF